MRLELGEGESEKRWAERAWTGEREETKSVRWCEMARERRGVSASREMFTCVWAN